jgi:hypothetical protein
MEYCVITLQNLLDLAPDKKLPIHQTHRYFVQVWSPQTLLNT